MTTISNTEDCLDVRNIIERFEELESERDDFVSGAPDGSETPDPEGWAREYPDDAQELATLKELLDDLKGNGGDHQWLGDWYPVTLLRHYHFVDAMKEMVEEIGDMPDGFPSYIEIDWDKTAENLRADYTSVDFDDVEYWYR